MRIPPVPRRKQNLLTRLIFALVRRKNGTLPAPLSVYGYKPKILRTFLSLAGAARGAGELPERLKRLAMYWTAHQVECPF